MSRNFTIAPQEFYHLYNRGTDKRKIFTRGVDYDRFLALLYLCNGTNPVNLREQGQSLAEVLENGVERGELLIDICAYVLMPNHFHILAREVAEGGISEYMRKIGNGYTGYFNRRYDRSGTLFQGTYKARHANKDVYLSHLLSYIHLNPVKLFEPTWKESGIVDRSGAENFLDRYKYSSYLDYCGNYRLESCIINRAAFPTEMKTPTDFKSSIKEWLKNKTEYTKV
ncbi:hypothetical protein A3D70_00260 [Candidatus Adlerbacteria bacterium RIFCSPHIGHO2_02_FULL_54_18]|uniref:Transposase IS200-like domain-containing protein n=2 Tax=Candidatus Adleribacteriota TaxID=1752736 RepID=A0A1F4Y4W0_9BACT|nr:MAG: hypothetical protein A2949_03025 [Candidatus Adlerbacteria bacterium RIFCSPLOWO2_01_FULL_54_21b]OGC88972.1 MAG: hypothetical protein A3D70_00260 [Candidatus Adlerbacteria bacterium RIFCSPHIGHO2_02_FULL_54_18]